MKESVPACQVLLAMLRGSASARLARPQQYLFFDEKGYCKMRYAHNVAGANLTQLKQRHRSINGARASKHVISVSGMPCAAIALET